MKHTPGPWRFSDPWVWAEGVNGPIARTVCSESTSVSACESNGDLIAAAPDLLAALKHLLNASVGMHGSEAELRAVTAIAKAEGTVKVS